MSAAEIHAFSAFVLALVAIVNIASIFLTRKYDRKQARDRILYDALNGFNSHRAQLEHVFSLEKKELIDWTDEDRNAANTICFDLFHIGSLVKKGLISKDFCELYYYAIPKTWEILEPYVQQVRGKRHKEYWKKYEELVLITIEHNKSSKFELNRKKSGEVDSN